VPFYFYNGTRCPKRLRAVLAQLANARTKKQQLAANKQEKRDSGDDSSDDSSFDSSGAGAESAGDSPQGKSDVVQSRQDGGFYTPPAAVSHRTRETERETRKLNGECSVVGGPSGVSNSTQLNVIY
jgi:hypothetical protein